MGGRLYLSGVSAGLAAQLRRAGKLDLGDTVQVVPAQEVLGESAREAIEAAGRWVGRR